LEFLALLSQMPPEEQHAFLKVIGQDLQQTNNLPCNVFGGTESCMSLPSNSSFAAVCQEHDLKVDCAYWRDDLKEINENPEEETKKLLKDQHMDDLAAACPQCFENQRRMWCSQTVPKCGSYQANVEGQLLPSIQKVVSAEERGQTNIEALAEVLPTLFQSQALALPCREMCEAVMSTCGCNKDRKFGDLLDHMAGDIQATGQEVPEGFTRQLFGALYDQPLCSLYARKDTPGFAGHCDALPTVCTDEDKWCNGDEGKNPGPTAVEELMALQLAKGLFGWIGDPSAGLNEDETGIIEDADDQRLKQYEDAYVRDAGKTSPSHAGKSSAGRIAGIVVACLGAAVLAGAAGFIWYRRRQQQMGISDYLELTEDFPEDREPLYLPNQR
jgi:hypothetical protein